MDPEGRPAPESSVVVVQPGEGPGERQGPADGIEHPGKVMRIAAMARHLLEEVRQAPLDEASRSRLREIYETSIEELAAVLADDLRDELVRLSTPFDAPSPTESELRVAHAQLVGWLEGLFHGIQAMLFAQELENRARLEEMRRQSLPRPSDAQPGAGQYL